MTSHIVIYGNSVFLAGIAASLAVHRELVVSNLDGNEPAPALLQLDPDVIIVDSAHHTAHLIEMVFFQFRRALLLISLDADNDLANVLVGRQQAVHRADDLVALMRMYQEGVALS